MVKKSRRAFDAQLMRVVAELSARRSSLTRHAAKNSALRLALAQLCRTVRKAVSQSRQQLRRMAQPDGRKRPAAARAGQQRIVALPTARLRRVLAHIDASMDQRLDVPSLAAVAGMSTGHFAAMFKCATGLTPHEAVTRRRLARSQELLVDGSLTIAQIGCQLGFSSQAHFCTAFRGRTGLSPTAWRAQQRARAVNQREYPIFSTNTKSSSEKFESHEDIGRVFIDVVTEPPRHSDTGASRPGTA
jgi:AraC-like DNA-binding protein